MRSKRHSKWVLLCWGLVVWLLAAAPVVTKENPFERTASLHLGNYRFGSLALDSENKRPRQFTGSWIWEEYQDAPGPLPHDDVLHWGSNLGPFHNYSEIVVHLNDLVADFSEYISFSTIGASNHSLPIHCAVVTAPGSSENRLDFLVVSHHHGREAITVENALYLLDYLLAYKDTPEVMQILENFVIYLIPTLNPDTLGMIHINPWQRKNLRSVDEDADGLIDEWEIQDVDGDFEVEEAWNGYVFEGIDLDADGKIGEDLPGGVDLNRNYPTGWAQGVSNNRSQIYRGTAPFSEPETQAMRTCIELYGANLTFALSLHSGIAALLAPWACNSTTPQDGELFALIGEAVQEASGYPYRPPEMFSSSYGVWEDWLLDEWGIPAMTLETYGNSSAYMDSIWDYFNPSANNTIPVCERVWDAFVAITEVLYKEFSPPTSSPPPDWGVLTLVLIGGGICLITLIVLVIWIRRRLER
ncbi:MAG: M14 family zinc carboxypeptidase [Promethearchaeota archaeon]